MEQQEPIAGLPARDDGGPAFPCDAVAHHPADAHRLLNAMRAAGLSLHDAQRILRRAQLSLAAIRNLVAKEREAAAADMRERAKEFCWQRQEAYEAKAMEAVAAGQSGDVEAAIAAAYETAVSGIDALPLTAKTEAR